MLTPDLKWNSHIRSNAKTAGETVGVFYHSSKYLTPPANLYLYMSQIEQKIAYCLYIWGGALQFFLLGLKSVFHGLVPDE